MGYLGHKQSVNELFKPIAKLLKANIKKAFMAIHSIDEQYIHLQMLEARQGGTKPRQGFLFS